MVVLLASTEGALRHQVVVSALGNNTGLYTDLNSPVVAGVLAPVVPG